MILYGNYLTTYSVNSLRLFFWNFFDWFTLLAVFGALQKVVGFRPVILRLLSG